MRYFLQENFPPKLSKMLMKFIKN